MGCRTLRTDEVKIGICATKSGTDGMDGNTPEYYSKTELPINKLSCNTCSSTVISCVSCTDVSWQSNMMTLP